MYILIQRYEELLNLPTRLQSQPGVVDSTKNLHSVILVSSDVCWVTQHVFTVLLQFCWLPSTWHFVIDIISFSQ